MRELAGKEVDSAMKAVYTTAADTFAFGRCKAKRIEMTQMQRVNHSNGNSVQGHHHDRAALQHVPG